MNILNLLHWCLLERVGSRGWLSLVVKWYLTIFVTSDRMENVTYVKRKNRMENVLGLSLNYKEFSSGIFKF